MPWFRNNRGRGAWRHPVFGTLLVLGAGVVSARLLADDKDKVMTGIRLPLEYHENGKVKTVLKAEKATIPEGDEPLLAQKVTCELFTVEGLPDILIHADDCRYDRKQQMMTSASPVCFEKPGVVIFGKGFEWSGEKQYIRILHDVTVVIFNKKSVKLRKDKKK